MMQISKLKSYQLSNHISNNFKDEFTNIGYFDALKIRLGTLSTRTTQDKNMQTSIKVKESDKGFSNMVSDAIDYIW